MPTSCCWCVFPKKKKYFPCVIFFDRAKVAWRAYGENAGEFVFSHHSLSLEGLPPSFMYFVLGVKERSLGWVLALLAKNLTPVMQNKWEQLRRKVCRHVTQRRKPEKWWKTNTNLVGDVKMCWGELALSHVGHREVKIIFHSFMKCQNVCKPQLIIADVLSAFIGMLSCRRQKRNRKSTTGLKIDSQTTRK